MSKPPLTDLDYCLAADKLRCEVAAIKAVADVETKGAAYYADGFPIILFERHVFRRLTTGKHSKSHPHLSGPAGGYGKSGQNQRNKFNEAFRLNADAAMQSCSWGRFQIMGFNYEVCGFDSVGAFVDAMKESEGKQLDAFVRFVLGNFLDDEIRGRKWAAFAKGYNGPDYKKNNYDTKMADAYRKFAKTPVDCKRLRAANAAAITAPAVTTTQVADNIVNTAPPPVTGGEETLTAPAKDGATTTAGKMTIGGIVVPGFVVAGIAAVKDVISQGYVSAYDVGQTVLGFIKENQRYVFLLIALLIVLLIVKKVVKQITFWLEMLTKAIPSWNSITVVPAETPKPEKKWWEIWK